MIVAKFIKSPDDLSKFVEEVNAAETKHNVVVKRIRQFGSRHGDPILIATFEPQEGIGPAQRTELSQNLKSMTKDIQGETARLKTAVEADQPKA